MNDIHVFLRALRRSAIWLLVIAVVACVAGFGATYLLRKPVFLASAMVAAGNPSDITTNLDSERLGEGLAPTYRQLAETDLVLDPVIKKLSLDTDAPTLVADGVVTAVVVDKTALVQITASAKTETEAIDIANGVANQLVTVGGGLQSPDQETPQLLTDLATLRGKIAYGEAALEPLVKSYLAAPTDVDNSEVARHIDAVQTQIRVWRDSYQATLQQLQISPQAHPLVVVTKASVAIESGGLKTALLSGVLASVAGLLLGVGAVFVFSQTWTESSAVDSDPRRRTGRQTPPEPSSAGRVAH